MHVARNDFQRRFVMQMTLLEIWFMRIGLRIIVENCLVKYHLDSSLPVLPTTQCLEY
jgi:hypothetical protein